MKNPDHEWGTVYKPNALPDSITRTLYIGFGIGKFNAGRIDVSPHKHSESVDFGVVPLLEKKITIKLPKAKVDVKNRMLEVLQAEKAKILAENHQRLKAVEEKISALLCIEYHPEDGEDA